MQTQPRLLGYRRLQATLALAFLAGLPIAAPACAETPQQICARVTNDDTLRPMPESLAASVNTLFGTKMPPQMVANTTVFRCMRGMMMVCMTGANLPCSKANTDRTPGAGMVQWCHDNPEAPFVPAVATGHDTIYQWRCHAGAPTPGQKVSEIDARGFFAQYWKPVQ